MKNLYDVGRIYIWQNCTGASVVLNGQETTAIGNAEEVRYEPTGEWFLAHETSTPNPCYSGLLCYAAAGNLRPKNPPSGEQGIRDLFKLPEEVDA